MTIAELLKELEQYDPMLKVVVCTDPQLLTGYELEATSTSEVIHGRGRYMLTAEDMEFSNSDFVPNAVCLWAV
ncbi:MAG: hypothetical protein KDH96_03265 [Candidatus Riesia sp.]|nr:hypothetical protein [Candidatus Riesia sp.]